MFKAPCKGCTKRCVEPLCRKTCEAWIKYETERNAMREHHIEDNKGIVFYTESGAYKKSTKYITCNKRYGR